MIYEYVSRDGETHVVVCPASQRPVQRTDSTGRDYITVGRKRFYRRYSFIDATPQKHRACNMIEKAENDSIAERKFHSPCPNNPGGVSDAQLVKSGKAKTRDMKVMV